MKIYNSVKTEKIAIEILQNWLDKKYDNEDISRACYIQETTLHCGCGETIGLKAFYEGSKEIAKIAICDRCGNNDTIRTYEL